MNKITIESLVWKIYQIFTYIWPNTNPNPEIKRNIENSMIRKSQILNFHSKDFRKMVFAEISEYFFGKIILENF